MAQSIRISDETYARAQQAARLLDRSLAQQLEYWARLGAAIDAAGITSGQAMQLLAGKDGVTDLLALARRGSGKACASEIDAWHRQLAAEVADGRRRADSLIAFDSDAVQASTVLYVAEPAPGEDVAGW